MPKSMITVHARHLKVLYYVPQFFILLQWQNNGRAKSLRKLLNNKNNQLLLLLLLRFHVYRTAPCIYVKIVQD